jgi:hypothetical protein
VEVAALARGVRKTSKRSDPRIIAQELTPLALETLAEILRGGASETVKLAAAREILDRGHGKPKAGEPEVQGPGGVTVVIRRFDEDEPDAGESAA